MRTLDERPLTTAPMTTASRAPMTTAPAAPLTTAPAAPLMTAPVATSPVAPVPHTLAWWMDSDSEQTVDRTLDWWLYIRQGRPGQAGHAEADEFEVWQNLTLDMFCITLVHFEQFCKHTDEARGVTSYDPRSLLCSFYSGASRFLARIRSSSKRFACSSAASQLPPVMGLIRSHVDSIS